MRRIGGREADRQIDRLRGGRADGWHKGEREETRACLTLKFAEVSIEDILKRKRSHRHACPGPLRRVIDLMHPIRGGGRRIRRGFDTNCDFLNRLHFSLDPELMCRDLDAHRLSPERDPSFFPAHGQLRVAAGGPFPSEGKEGAARSLPRHASGDTEFTRKGRSFLSHNPIPAIPAIASKSVSLST